MTITRKPKLGAGPLDDGRDEAWWRAVSEASQALAEPSHTWTAQDYQRTPQGDWDFWFFKGGRGCGKTDVASHYFDAHMRGPACIPGVPGGHRGAIIAPTLDDARETCIRGVTGLLAANHDAEFNVNRSVVKWPNGAEARIFGAYNPDDPDRLRGPQHCVVWGEEVASWKQLDATWNMMRFGLRLGSHPHGILTSTPKPRPLIRALVDDPKVVVTNASTSDNRFLHAVVRASLEDKYGGTRLGRQELEGELLLDVPGAMWLAEWIERSRVVKAPEMLRVVVAVDPAATSAEESDESAVAVCGLGEDGDYYVLAADGYHLSPSGWAGKAFDAYDTYAADRIVAEVNNGGDMVVSTLRKSRPSVPVRSITATRGKALRAEPIALLYEQNRVHHVGTFEVLEDQMCTFPVANEHDDRIDALVYAMTELTEKNHGALEALRSQSVAASAIVEPVARCGHRWRNGNVIELCDKPAGHESSEDAMEARHGR